VLWSNFCDPYGDFVDYLDLEETDGIKQLFVRAPDSDIWLDVCTEFPSHIEQAIWERSDRGEGYQENDHLPNHYRFRQQVSKLPLPMQNTIKQLAKDQHGMGFRLLCGGIDDDGSALVWMWKTGDHGVSYRIKLDGEAVRLKE
jgi:hypothetical protein